MSHKTLINKAIRLCGGRQISLANAMVSCGAPKTISQSHVGFWARGEKRISPENAYYLEKATEGVVKVSDLYPTLRSND